MHQPYTLSITYIIFLYFLSSVNYLIRRYYGTEDERVIHGDWYRVSSERSGAYDEYHDLDRTRGDTGESRVYPSSELVST